MSTMTHRLPALTPDTAVGAARNLLADLVARHGHVSATVRTMANSPAVLGGYPLLSRSMKRAKLDRRVSELVSVALQVHQGCEVCLDAHESAARTLGVSEEEIQAARRSTSSDPPVEAMTKLAFRVYREPTALTDEQVERLRALGSSNREIADVVGLGALNVLTGAFNLMAGIVSRSAGSADGERIIALCFPNGTPLGAVEQNSLAGRGVVERRFDERFHRRATSLARF